MKVVNAILQAMKLFAKAKGFVQGGVEGALMKQLMRTKGFKLFVKTTVEPQIGSLIKWANYFGDKFGVEFDTSGLFDDFEWYKGYKELKDYANTFKSWITNTRGKLLSSVKELRDEYGGNIIERWRAEIMGWFMSPTQQLLEAYSMDYVEKLLKILDKALDKKDSLQKAIENQEEIQILMDKAWTALYEQQLWQNRDSRYAEKDYASEIYGLFANIGQLLGLDYRTEDVTYTYENGDTDVVPELWAPSSSKVYSYKQV